MDNQVNLSDLLRMFNHDTYREDVLMAVVPASEVFLFFKNWSKGGAGTLKVSGPLATTVKWLAQGFTVEELREAAGNILPISRSQVKGLLDVLVNTGIAIYLPVQLVER